MNYEEIKLTRDDRRAKAIAGYWYHVKYNQKHVIKKAEITGKALKFGLDYLRIEEPPSIEFFYSDNHSHLGLHGRYDFIEKKIFIKGDSFAAKLELILFHELVHHKQFECGFIKNKGQSFFWKKSLAKGNSYEVETEKQYRSSPHEIQARAISENMLEKWDLVYKKWY